MTSKIGEFGMTWFCGLVLIGVLAMAGCSKQSGSTPQTASAPPPPECGPAPGTDYCDFKDGSDDAKVKVDAYYPGRHEDTLAAVKDLTTLFPGKVQIEIIDWRREEGMKRRAEAGLTCAGVMINGKNAFDLQVDGKPVKVLFARGIDGEWTKQDLVAAVKQAIEAAQ